MSSISWGIRSGVSTRMANAKRWNDRKGVNLEMGQLLPEVGFWAHTKKKKEVRNLNVEWERFRFSEPEMGFVRGVLEYPQIRKVHRRIPGSGVPQKCTTRFEA